MGSPQLVSNQLKKTEAFNMRYRGECLEKVAETIDAPYATVATYFSREWKNDYQDYISKLSDEAKEAAVNVVRLNSIKAVKVLEQLLDSCDDRIRFIAAKEILDRGIGKPSQDLKSQCQHRPIRDILRGYGLVDVNGEIIKDDNLEEDYVMTE